MKHGHLTEQRKQFVEAYCRLGNGTLAAKEAGYKDSPSLGIRRANWNGNYLWRYQRYMFSKEIMIDSHIIFGPLKRGQTLGFLNHIFGMRIFLLRSKVSNWSVKLIWFFLHFINGTFFSYTWMCFNRQLHRELIVWFFLLFLKGSTHFSPASKQWFFFRHILCDHLTKPLQIVARNPCYMWCSAW